MERNGTKDIDVLIMAEGTYPYISGGVSTWIHHLITGLPEYRFGVVFIGARPDDYGERKFELPANLVHLESHFIFDDRERPAPTGHDMDEGALSRIRELHKWFKERHTEGLPGDLSSMEFYTAYLKEEAFLYGRNAWRFIKELYFNYDTESPFVDYFWTIRNVHAPIWRLAGIAERVPPHRIIHSPSTGYAGFLASLLRHGRRGRLILTEHGIYTRERKIDLMNADWLVDRRFFFQKRHGEMEHLREIWINFFESIGRFTYNAADLIISLFDGARQIQIGLGAAPEKTRTIPNGVDLKALSKLRVDRKDGVPWVVTLIGRVVPIKDIKTFINAMKVVVQSMPDVQGWVVGPTDEDPEYYSECIRLVEALGLSESVRFLGRRDIHEVLPASGIVTLTSVSEGMPLVVIEAFAAGVPVVTTDVGSCRQLIQGGPDDADIRIGAAGEVTPIANPRALAVAYIRLLSDVEYWKRCREAGIKRVESYYTMDRFIDAYREIYRDETDGWNRV